MFTAGFEATYATKSTVSYIEKIARQKINRKG